MIYRTTKEESIAPFDELMLSWNAPRPKAGNLLFYVRVKLEGWSDWLPYASWGSDGQTSCSHSANGVRVYQDVVEVLGGQKASGFEIKIEGGTVNGIYVYTNSPSPSSAPSFRAISLKMKGLSQMQVRHARCKDLCSPTSTAAVTRFLAKKEIDPVEFAIKAWDGGFDIFGNWVLNVAQASAELGPDWHCWVERLNGFEDIYRRLERETPVIVSVRGPLPGSALPYAKGHLVVVTGYDPKTHQVECMDPAFATDAETAVRYPLLDFVEAWKRRGKVAYIFEKRERVDPLTP